MLFLLFVLAEKQFNVGTRRLAVRRQRDRSASSLVYVRDTSTVGPRCEQAKRRTDSRYMIAAAARPMVAACQLQRNEPRSLSVTRGALNLPDGQGERYKYRDRPPRMDDRRRAVREVTGGKGICDSEYQAVKSAIKGGGSSDRRELRHHVATDSALINHESTAGSGHFLDIHVEKFHRHPPLMRMEGRKRKKENSAVVRDRTHVIPEAIQKRHEANTKKFRKILCETSSDKIYVNMMFSCTILRKMELLRADEGEEGWVWGGAGVQGRGKREIPEEARRPAASSSTTLLRVSPGRAAPRIEPGSPRWKAGILVHFCEMRWSPIQLEPDMTEKSQTFQLRVGEAGDTRENPADQRHRPTRFPLGENPELVGGEQPNRSATAAPGGNKYFSSKIVAVGLQHYNLSVFEKILITCSRIRGLKTSIAAARSVRVSRRRRGQRTSADRVSKHRLPRVCGINAIPRGLVTLAYVRSVALGARVAQWLRGVALLGAAAGVTCPASCRLASLVPPSPSAARCRPITLLAPYQLCTT
ncbi:hypothetical protein PR048_026232 [Dryococelus australis]|uniref:Uncharacterized protein n=1 Tax=Dryococelus australis TaxID=614101 RepID=A0ABQ9GKT1_9NEOP|nr:hypothetical protein PR048_026232 [Dryococelus australis]